MIILITLSSERGIRREPSLLPDDYCGGVVDEGCVSGGTNDTLSTRKEPGKEKQGSSLFTRIWTFISSFFRWAFGQGNNK